MHAPSLFPDFTLFIQLGIFLLSFLVLRALVFKPFLQLLQLRRDRTIGLMEKATKDTEKAAKLKSDYDLFMTAERKKVAAWMEEERRKIGDEERRLIQTAREAATEDLNAARQKITSDAEQARRELAPLVGEYSSQIVSKLLDRKVTVSAHSSGKTNQAEKVVPS